MEDILSLFEEHTQMLADSLNPNLTYEQRCQQRNMQQEIIEQLTQLQAIIAQLKNKANILRMLQHKQPTFIQEHHQMPTILLKEIVAPKLTVPQQQLWTKFVQINHSIKISVRITEINVFMRQWGNIENQLSFQRFRVHLHHVDKHASSQHMVYHPCRGMQHISGSVDKKQIKSNAEIILSLEHVIRSHNYQLYSQLFQKESVTLVVERTDGCVIAIAEIDISLLANLQPRQRVPSCVKFVRRLQTQQNLTEEPVFFANCFIGVQSTVISPQIDELNKNIQSHIKEAARNRSTSPNRIISISNKITEKSPKKKRQLVRKLLSPQQNRVNLSIYECWEYKYKLQLRDLPYSKELIYKSVLNLKDRKLQLVKIGEDYYFKLFAVKQDSSKPAQILFSFNKTEYRAHVLPNNLFQTIVLSDYKVKSKVERKDTQIIYKNCLIDLGRGNLIYALENNRFQKNLNKLQVDSGMLGTIFVRSFLNESQIKCSKPFNLVEITKKEDGFMLTYQYLQKIAEEKEQLLIVYLRSKHNNINEIHIYDCQISPRNVTRQSLYRGQIFPKLSLKMIASDKAIYEIESADNQKVRVVNGSHFEYRTAIKEDLELQVIGSLPLLADLLFRDNKNRSFFLRLSIKEDQTFRQQQ